MTFPNLISSSESDYSDCFVSAVISMCIISHQPLDDYACNSPASFGLQIKKQLPVPWLRASWQ